MFGKRNRPSSAWFKVALLPLGIIIFSVVLYLVFIGKNQVEKDVKVSSAPSSSKVDATPGGESTQEYQQRLDRYNLEKYQESEKTGKTFVPTAGAKKDDENNFDENLLMEEEEEEPEEQNYDHLNKTEEPKEKPTLKRANEPKEPKNEHNPEQKQKLIERYAKQMEAVMNDSLVRPTSHDTLVFAYEKTETVNDSEEKKFSNNKISGLDLKVGDVLYAVNDISLNSDISGPVKATVISGKYNGSSLIGSFQRREKYLVVEFSNIVTPDGEQYNIDSVAVNPDVPEYAVRSRVNNRTIQRWGSLIASSFLQGFAKSVEQSGTKSQVSNDVVTRSYPEYSVGDQLWIAGGEVANKVGQVTDKNFNRPPTVYLDAGLPLGVLILGI